MKLRLKISGENLFFLCQFLVKTGEAYPQDTIGEVVDILNIKNLIVKAQRKMILLESAKTSKKVIMLLTPSEYLSINKVVEPYEGEIKNNPFFMALFEEMKSQLQKPLSNLIIKKYE